MSFKRAAAILLCSAAWLRADDTQLKRRDPLPPNGVSEYRIDEGKRIPVKLLNTLSIRPGILGDRLNLQVIFPVVVLGRTLIPAGSYLEAELSAFRRFARGKGRAEFDVRLGQLTLPNGDHLPLKKALGTISAAATARGADIVVVPGTTTEIVVQDPIVFPVEPGGNR